MFFNNAVLELTCPQQYLRDCFFMQFAIAAAKHAQELDEVPIGAVVILDDMLVASDCNRVISRCDSSAHAEMLVLRSASSKIGNYRLVNCELFTTLEPCVMCAGAIMQTRIKRVVFGAYNTKMGAAGSIINLFNIERLNSHTSVTGGIEKIICQQLLQDFFFQKRCQKIKNIRN